MNISLSKKKISNLSRLITSILLLLTSGTVLPANLAAQEHNIDLLPTTLRGELNQSISQVLNGFFIFSTTDAVSSGQYRIKNSGEQHQRLRVNKISGTHSFGNKGEDSIIPFLMGQVGTSHFREEIPPFEGDGDNDFSTISSLNVGAGAGVAFVPFQSFTITPDFQAVYSHTENHYDFNNNFSQNILQLFDRDLFNWDIDTITYMPSIGVSYEQKLDTIKLIPSLKYTQMFIDSTWTNSELLDVNTSSGVLNSRIDAHLPTDRCVFGKELELRPFISRTDIYRDARAGLGFGSFHQAGMSILVATGNSIPLISSIGIASSYVWNSDFEGWRLGLEAAL